MDPTKIAAIHLGHSHLAAMVSHLHDRKEVEEDCENTVKHFIFDIFTHKDVFKIDASRYHYGKRLPDGKFVFNEEILAKIKATVPADHTPVYITQFGGNAYNTLTLLTIGTSYDFWSPFVEGVIPGRELIPYNAVEAVIRQNCKIFTEDLRGLAASVTAPIYHIVSPPPIYSSEKIDEIKKISPYFSKLDSTEVTPPSVRLKAWYCQKQIYKETCDQIGALVMDPPAQAVTDGRWLAEPCIGNDPTHGNYRYSAMIFQEIEATLKARFVGWEWIR